MSALWADALLRSSLQGGLAGLVVLGIVKAFPRIPAAVQVWLWRIVAIKLLLGLALPITIFRPSSAMGGSGDVGLLPDLIAALSGLGLLVASIATVYDAFAAHKLTQGALPVEPVEARAMARDLGLRRTPRIMVKRDLTRPLLVGMIRPTILIPPDLDPAELRMVLAHEMAHVRRRDLPYGWLIVALEGLFFFHPVTWILRRELRMAQEIACDALAMKTSQTSLGAYGRMLLSMTVAASRRELALTAQMAGTYAALRRRIVRLQQNERRLRLPSVLALTLLTVALFPTWRSEVFDPTARATRSHPSSVVPVRYAERIGSAPVPASPMSKEATPK